MALDMKIEDLLLKTLEDLEQEDFKKFKYYMDLPKSKKENADRIDIAEQLTNTHGQNAVAETIKILEKINNYNLAQKLRNDLPQITGSISSVDDEQIGKYKRELQENLRKIYLNVPEGNPGNSRQEPLENVYTELNITRGVAGLPNKQHEVLQMEMCGVAEEESIQPCDIFQSQEPLHTMLTVGFAGIGKTFLVRKFVLDWASGETNTDVDFIFPLAFRELNLEEKKSFSLAELIRLFVWESKAIKMLDQILVSLQESPNRHYQSSEIKILFVLDGLDESRLKLDLNDERKVDLDVTRAYPVEVLLAHLIKGNLLPCARVWITTRPQAAHDIPPRLVDARTEVKGFSDSQRMDYFRKRFPAEEDVIKHIQKSRTILIMCHLPIFCWITATVLRDHRKNGKELPETLTEMYTEFLLYHLDKSKERDSQKSTEYVTALAKLAFQQLMKKQQIFYESDLRESGLDDPQGAKHSGVFTVVFKEVPPLKKYQRKMFQFIHLTIQEYLAALHVMMSLFQDDTNVLDNSRWTRKGLLLLWKRKQLTRVHEAAIRKASKSEGNLDLFLRFLLGLSLQCNQDLLGELLKVPKNYRHSKAETVRLIKRRIKRNSPEENINLFYCLKELKDESLLEQIQQYLKGGKLSTKDLPPAMWSALLFFLRASDEAMSCFDLRKYAPSEKGLLMLLPVVKASQKSVLQSCKLRKKSCEALASVLSSPGSLRELDLSKNDLLDDGLEALAAGLAKLQCTLQVLRLIDCKLSKKSCEALASVLISSRTVSHLDLSENNLHDHGLEALAAGLAKPQCTLQVLELEDCKLSKKSCEALASVLSSPGSLRELDLSNNDLCDGLEALATGLAKPQCTLEVLKLRWCQLSKKSCEALASVLSSPSSLRELDLSFNNLHDHGLEALATGLAKPQCTLQILGLEYCKLSKKSCEALASVLSSPGSLSNLDLSKNDLCDDGLEALAAGLAKPQCTLQVLRLRWCQLSKKSCEALASVLSSPGRMRELDLSENDLRDDGLKALAAGLAKPQCTLQVLGLQHCKLSKKSCEALASVLSSPGSLRELDLGNNVLHNDGLEALATGLAKPQCTLQVLGLMECEISTRGCVSLAKALRSNPSHLQKLNLWFNDIKEKGKRVLEEVQMDPRCSLKIEWRL
ncbi:NACHT, LRR and PYD domains-containing protein 3-like isoform X2 [Syngnathus typhle]|uniref:NACHT, LRR and PYD domains-containing protein 3-like isoform X2 n=1 Tax=Syngnathus typhle TaxID=161592 RepID=UPI002A6AAF7C|nr:NACHT, LRR and PYD domains-containing protein 3-like isoform X2 [Syngnathus typhle]